MARTPTAGSERERVSTAKLREGVYVQIIESPGPADLFANRTERFCRGVLEICGIKPTIAWLWITPRSAKPSLSSCSRT